MSDHRCPVSFLVTIGVMVISVGCEDLPRKAPVVTIQVQECAMGDSCVFRQNVGSALVLTTWNAYQRFRRARVDRPGDDFKWYSDQKAKGDMAILLKGTRIRVVRAVD